jgi:hypothetical protein
LIYTPSGDLTWPLEAAPQSLTVLLEGINGSAAPINDGGVLHLGPDSGTGAALAITGTATTYQLTFSNGISSVSSTLSSAVGNVRWRMLVQLEDNGTTQRVRFGISINESVLNMEAWTSTLTRAAAFPSGSKVRLNRAGSAGADGAALFRRLSIYPGLLTLDEATARL